MNRTKFHQSDRDRFLMLTNKILKPLRDGIGQYRELSRWNRGGRTEPPPHIYKAGVVSKYGKRFSSEILIETGTYVGQMVEACRRQFIKVISIELDEALYEQAKARFIRFPHITIIHGDSGQVLPTVLSGVRGRCVFWLDGHYSGGVTARGNRETPIIEELRHIQSHGEEHVILIDDARLFSGKDDYPSIEELESFVRELWPLHSFSVKDDIIRIHPPVLQRFNRRGSDR